jgi:hypothetical protein
VTPIATAERARLAQRRTCAIVCRMQILPARAPAVAGLGLCLLAVVGCQPRLEHSKNEQNDVAAETPAPAPSLPSAERPLDRSAILIAAAKAGSAAALGQDDLSEQRQLDGKTFEIRIRFGCATSSAGAPKVGPFNVRFDSADRTLRVRAAPDLTRETPQVAMSGVEHVEGFWMRRPWLLTPGCPASAATPGASTSPVSEQRVGIAQFSTSTDARTGRRDGRPYEATKVLEDGAVPSRQGYDLVLSGRLRRYPDGRVIICRISGAEVPPECVISAQFDRVRIQTPDGKSTLGDWSR